MNLVSNEAATWAVEAGLTGLSEQELLRGFYERALKTGVPIARALVGIDMLTRCLRCERSGDIATARS